MNIDDLLKGRISKILLVLIKSGRASLKIRKSEFKNEKERISQLDRASLKLSGFKLSTPI